MKLRLSLPIAVFLTLLTVALCTGSQLFLLLSVMILLIVLGAVLAVLWASLTLHVEGNLSGETVLAVLRGIGVAYACRSSAAGSVRSCWKPGS